MSIQDAQGGTRDHWPMEAPAGSILGPITITVKNTGDIYWASGMIALKPASGFFRFVDCKGNPEPRCLTIERDVPSGETYTFTFYLSGPEITGVYAPHMVVKYGYNKTNEYFEPGGTVGDFIPAPSIIFTSNLEYLPPVKNVILISWDCVPSNFIGRMLAEGELPNLKKLIANGRLVNIDIGGHQTDTRAGHCQMLTGYHPYITGVYSNRLWKGNIPQGLTIFEKLKEAYAGKGGIATGMFTCKLGPLAGLDKKDPDGKTKDGLHYFGYEPYDNVLSPANPYGIAEGDWTILHEDESLNAFAGSQEYGPGVRDFLNRSLAKMLQGEIKRFFLFFHLGAADSNMHTWGRDSRDYEAGVSGYDTVLGQLLDYLEAHGLAETTLIYVTTDHGYDENNIDGRNENYQNKDLSMYKTVAWQLAYSGKYHKQAFRAFLATNDYYVTRPGNQVDIAPHIYYRLGIDTSQFEIPLSGQPLTTQRKRWNWIDWQDPLQ